MYSMWAPIQRSQVKTRRQLYCSQLSELQCDTRKDEGDEMTDEQKRKATALRKCTFPVGSSQKRFARDMADVALHHPEKELTEKQVKYLDILFHQYRRQIRVSHARLCDCNEAKNIRAQTLMFINAPTDASAKAEK
jgi:hypothetical protein